MRTSSYISSSLRGLVAALVGDGTEAVGTGGTGVAATEPAGVVTEPAGVVLAATEGGGIVANAEASVNKEMFRASDADAADVAAAPAVEEVCCVGNDSS